MPSTKLLPTLAEELSKAAYNRVLPKIRSNQLRRGMRREQRGESSWALHIPHFWAVYFHDGRGPVYSKRNGYLVWFRNPNNDPRLRGGLTPERLSQTRRLSKVDFQKWSTINRNIVKRYRQRTGRRVLTSSDYEAMQLPMVVIKMSPRDARPVPGALFFDNGPNGGMSGFKQYASRYIVKDTSLYVLYQLRRRGLTGSGNTQITKHVTVG